MSAARRESPPETPQPPLERWLRAHTEWVGFALILLGLWARLRAAHAPFLTPDEALHLQIAASDGFAATYRTSLGNAHPPLFFLLLHAWRSVARSDWQLRLLPVAFGTVFLWAAWRWATAVFGRACGLLTLSLLAFLPALVLVSSELRAYSLLLAALAGALLALEDALARRSAARAWRFTALAAIALASHYAAFRVLAAAGLYAAVRIVVERLPRRFLAAWAAGQAALVCLAAYFVASHVSRLRGSALEREVQGTWLAPSYWRGGESPLRFLGRQTLDLFQYVFSTRAGAAAGLVLFAGGLLWLVFRRRAAAILVGVPLALAAVGGLLAVYPYGGTRHSADLALLLCGGAGLALARATGERLWAAVAVAGALSLSAFLVSG